MARGSPWSRDELVLAMNLYCRLSFGQYHARNPVIIDVARRMGRTPGSVAMKLCNLASLDPAQQQRGVRGLAHAGAADRAIWEQFHDDWDRMGAESELAMAALLGEPSSPPSAYATSEGPPDTEPIISEAMVLPGGPTEVERIVRARSGQQFFRRTVLASYHNACAVTGNPVPELLNASHILPWADFPDKRMDPRNGICLAAHFDRAFDRGLVTFDDDLRLVVSPALRAYVPNDALEREFLSRQGTELRLPDRFRPARDALSFHRERIFLEG